MLIYSTKKAQRFLPKSSVVFAEKLSSFCSKTTELFSQWYGAFFENYIALALKVLRNAAFSTLKHAKNHFATICINLSNVAKTACKTLEKYRFSFYFLVAYIGFFT